MPTMSDNFKTGWVNSNNGQWRNLEFRNVVQQRDVKSNMEQNGHLASCI